MSVMDRRFRAAILERSLADHFAELQLAAYTRTCQFGHHDRCPGEYQGIHADGSQNPDDTGACACTCHNEETPSANSGSVSEIPEKETNMMSIIADTTDTRINDHANDEIKAVRTTPESELPEGFELHDHYPQGVIVYDSYDQEGNNVEAALPDVDLDWEYPNDVYRDDNGITHVYRGNYWIREIIDGVVQLDLGVKVRCDNHDWCVGHHLQDDELEPDRIYHAAESEVLHEFTKLNGRLGLQQAEVNRQIENGTDALHVTVNIEAPFTRLELRTLADELVALADKLVERGAAMEAN